MRSQTRRVSTMMGTVAGVMLLAFLSSGAWSQAEEPTAPPPTQEKAVEKGDPGQVQERAVIQGFVVLPPIVTVIDLNGRWTDGSTRSAAISAAGTALTIDMSAWGRPAANGSIINGSTITVTFPDDASYTGILQPPNTIRWSNGSAWAKVAQPAPSVPIVRRPTDAAPTICGGPILSRAIMPEKAPTTGTMAPLAGQPAPKVIMPGTVPTTGTNLPNPDKTEQSFVYPPSAWGFNLVGATGLRVQDHPRLMADVNGDGKQDIVAFGNDGVLLALSTGTGFTAPTFVVADFGYNQGWRVENHPRLMADVNGDGRDRKSVV